MNKWKVFATVLTVITVGLLRESYRLFTSTDQDIASVEIEAVFCIAFTIVFLVLTILVWKKTRKNDQW